MCVLLFRTRQQVLLTALQAVGRLGILALVHSRAVLAASSHRLLLPGLLLTFTDFRNLDLQALELPVLVLAASTIVGSRSLQRRSVLCHHGFIVAIVRPRLLRLILEHLDLIVLELNVLNELLELPHFAIVNLYHVSRARLAASLAESCRPLGHLASGLALVHNLMVRLNEFRYIMTCHLLG